MSLLECGCWQGVLRSSLCPSCWKKLSTSFYSRNVQFQFSGVPFMAASCYTPMMKQIIALCKKSQFNGLAPALDDFVLQVVEHWSGKIAELDVQVIATVPGHPLRSVLQSDLAWLIARYLSKTLKIAAPQKLFSRPLRTESFFWSGQKHRTRHERLEHYAKFPMKLREGRKSDLPGRILLVDDVSTTGATLHACVEALRTASYDVAGVFVLSRVELGMEKHKKIDF